MGHVHQHRDGEAAAGRTPAVSRTARGHAPAATHGPGPARGLAAAGNAAFAGLLHAAAPARAAASSVARALGTVQDRRSGGAFVVQRHSSWEHALMGDTRPKELASAVGKMSSNGRHHVITQEWQRARFFKENPRAVPETSAGGLFEGMRVLHLQGSGLYVTYGEVNALADYLPNGSHINAMTAPQLIPVLQFMRQEIADSCVQALGTGGVDGEQARIAGAWAGAQRPGISGSAAGLFSRPGATVLTEEAATRSRGFQSYTGLVSRNACHFAPMSWERFSQNHTKAVDSAREAYTFRLGGADHVSAETQAWVHNGYADHFLEDSFAAGHLINKTLIMQWFMEYARSRGPLPTKIQMPSATMVRAMGTGAQQHVAGQDLYQLMENAEDVHHGRPGAVEAPTTVPTDPQTASETRGGGATAEDRAALGGVARVSGMTERQVAHQYQLFLSNAFLQRAAGLVHDHFNSLTSDGLVVENGLGRRFRVGGDDTQLLLSDAAGAQVVIDAVNLSRRAVQETLDTGRESTSGMEILMHVPTKVVLGQRPVGLREWNETVVRAYCNELFPEVYDSVTANIVRRLGALPRQPDPDLAATR